jgi:poly-beta-1,6-N-acetyl-D-glucosamine synthase
VVCSGCTDKTLEIVQTYQKNDDRIAFIDEPVRKGKANALNILFSQAKKQYDILVLANADASPENGSIEALVTKLNENPTAGAVFAQPVPFKGPRGISYRIAKSIWKMHHIISQGPKPKLSGELCALRSACLQELPEKIATDEPYIEYSVLKQGYSILYLPEAIVRIRCPVKFRDLLNQRRRIWIGHMQLRKQLGFEVSTSSFTTNLKVLFDLSFVDAFYAFLGSFVEIIAYFQAKRQSKKEIPYIWAPIASTKTVLNHQTEAS